MFKQPYGLSITLSILFLAALLRPVVAHEVKIASEVAATFHIEPDHNPKVGQQTLAWFALTQQGGELIPLEQCACKLEVHANPHTEGAKPLLEPALRAVSADQYQRIPGAEIVFPKMGSYELELSGAPKASAKFQPFKLSYTVTVGAGAAVPSTAQSSTAGPTAPKTTENGQEVRQKLAPSLIPWQIIALIGMACLAVATVAFWLQRSKR